MKYDLSNNNDVHRFNTKVEYLILNKKKVDLSELIKEKKIL